MLLYVHNLPPNFNYRDIENLITTKCGISSLILDNLINEGSGLRVTVGLIDKADAAIVMREINRLFLGEYQLFVEDVRKSLTSDQIYKSPQVKLEKEYQLFLDDVFNKSSSERSYENSQMRPQNLSTPFNCDRSNNDLSNKVSTSSMPLPITNLPEQIYYRSPTCEAPNNARNQAMHLLSQAEALDSSISHLGRNSIQQQKSQYQFGDIVSSMNHNINNYSRQSQMSLGKNDHYSYSIDSQPTDRNDKAPFSHTESKMNRRYVHEEGHRLKRSSSPHHNSASPKIINLREYKRHEEPHRKRMWRPMSGTFKRRFSPSNIQMHKSKYPRKNSPAVFSTTRNLPQTSFPTQKYEEETLSNSNYRSDIAQKIMPPRKSFSLQKYEASYNQGSFDKPSYSPGIEEKVIPNVTQMQQPVLMTDLNNTVYNMANSMFLFDKHQGFLPSTSQSTTFVKFNSLKQEGKSVYIENRNKPAINPWDPNVVQFEDMSLKKKEPPKRYITLQKIINKDEINRRTAVGRIMKEMNFGIHKKIWIPSEPSFQEKFKFRQIFLKELKAEVLRRVNEILKDELLVPIHTIIERYKNKYSSNNHKQFMKLINNRANKKFAMEYKGNIKKSNAADNISTVQTLQNNSSKIQQEVLTKGVDKQQINQSQDALVQQDKAKLPETQNATANPEAPKWLRDLKQVACFIHYHIKQTKGSENNIILSNLKAVLFGELYYYKMRGYQTDDSGKNDTLTPHLIDYYKAQKENLLVVSPIHGMNLPEFSTLCDFLQPYNVIGFRKFTSRNIYFVLLETKKECEKLYAMEKTQIDGKVVKFQSMTEATDLFKGPLLHINTVGSAVNNKKDIKSENPGKLKEIHDSVKNSNNATMKTECVTKNKTEVFNSNKNINNNPQTRGAAENQIIIAKADIKEPNVVIGSPEEIAQTRTDLIKNHTNTEKGRSIVSQNSANAPKTIKELTVHKNDDNSSVKGKALDFTDTLPDDPLSDEEVEINMDDLEDY